MEARRHACALARGFQARSALRCQGAGRLADRLAPSRAPANAPAPRPQPGVARGRVAGCGAPARLGSGNRVFAGSNSRAPPVGAPVYPSHPCLHGARAQGLRTRARALRRIWPVPLFYAKVPILLLLLLPLLLLLLREGGRSRSAPRAPGDHSCFHSPLPRACPSRPPTILLALFSTFAPRHSFPARRPTQALQLPSCLCSENQPLPARGRARSRPPASTACTQPPPGGAAPRAAPTWRGVSVLATAQPRPRPPARATRRHW